MNEIEDHVGRLEGITYQLDRLIQELAEELEHLESAGISSSESGRDIGVARILILWRS